jgi:hypothetical protein
MTNVVCRRHPSGAALAGVRALALTLRAEWRVQDVSSAGSDETMEVRRDPQAVSSADRACFPAGRVD